MRRPKIAVLAASSVLLLSSPAQSIAAETFSAADAQEVRALFLGQAAGETAHDLAAIDSVLAHAASGQPDPVNIIARAYRFWGREAVMDHFRTTRFPVRTNFGQWLRWEAALEEIRAYYSVPDEFRMLALARFGEGVARIIASSPSLRLLPQQQRPASDSADDEELAQPTIFPFVLQRDGRVLSPDDCRKVCRALSRDAVSAGECRGEPEIAATICLVGQPVVLGQPAQPAVAALRVCAGARLVTGAWSSEDDKVRGNLWRELGQVGAIVAKIEWLLAHPDAADLTEDRP